MLIYLENIVHTENLLYDNEIIGNHEFELIKIRSKVKKVEKHNHIK